MPLARPTATVTINGVATNWTEWHTQHSVEAAIGQASVTIPRPIPSNVFEGAKLVITAANDTGDTPRTCFVGQIRGPVSHALSESDAQVTFRADGNLWKLSLPALADFAWVGPITPRKLLKQMLLFYGIPHTMSKVEQFVHPTTGVPVILGGVPWFDDGRIILTEGSSPLSLADRICRLFGYRIYDRPDGTVRVSRLNGRPPASDYTVTEGDDVLSATRELDLHELVTYVQALGASGSDPSGAEVAIISRPKRGIKSKFVPKPPKFIAGQVNDSLLVTYPLAAAARVAREKDVSGPAWRVRAEVHDAPGKVAALAPRSAFTAAIPDVGIAGELYWQTGINQDFTNQGYWATITGWRPKGKAAKDGRIRPPEDVDDPEDPWESDADTKTPPSSADLNPPDAAPEDFDGTGEVLPAAWDLDNDGGYVPAEDPDFDASAPAYDPVTNPTGFLDTPPEEGPFDFCPPAATCRRCEYVPLDEPSWESDPLDAPIWTFIPPIDTDTITVHGEEALAGGTIEIWQNDELVGSATLPSAGTEEWATFEVVIEGTLIAGLEAEVQVYV